MLGVATLALSTSALALPTMQHAVRAADGDDWSAQAKCVQAGIKVKMIGKEKARYEETYKIANEQLKTPEQLFNSANATFMSIQKEFDQKKTAVMNALQGAADNINTTEFGQISLDMLTGLSAPNYNYETLSTQMDNKASKVDEAFKALKATGDDAAKAQADMEKAKADYDKFYDEMAAAQKELQSNVDKLDSANAAQAKACNSGSDSVGGGVPELPAKIGEAPKPDPTGSTAPDALGLTLGGDGTDSAPATASTPTDTSSTDTATGATDATASAAPAAGASDAAAGVGLGKRKWNHRR